MLALEGVWATFIPLLYKIESLRRVATEAPTIKPRDALLCRVRGVTCRLWRNVGRSQIKVEDGFRMIRSGANEGSGGGN